MKHRADVTDRTRLWAVASVTTRREEYVAGLLQTLGCETFYPVSTEWRWHRRKRKTIGEERAAVPGYLFLRSDTLPDNRDIMYFMEGFHYLLRRADDELSYVTQSDIDWMREHLGDGHDKLSELMKPTFELNEPVRVVPEGPFGSMYGIVTGLEKGRAWVGGGDFKKPVSIPLMLLRKVDS